jgi:hypothetical protein
MIVRTQVPWFKKSILFMVVMFLDFSLSSEGQRISNVRLTSGGGAVHFDFDFGRT